MGKQVHVPVPGIEWPHFTVHRQVGKAGVGDRHGLDGYFPSLHLILGRGEECALEGKNPVAVAGGTLGKQDQLLARLEALAHGVHVLADPRPAAVDKDGTLQLGEQAKERPRSHFRLGDEASPDQGAENGDVEIGGVVAHVETGLVTAGSTPDVKVEADQPQDDTVIELGKGVTRPPPRCQQHELHRHADQGPADIEYRTRKTDRDHAPPGPVSASPPPR